MFWLTICWRKQIFATKVKEKKKLCALTIYAAGVRVRLTVEMPEKWQYTDNKTENILPWLRRKRQYL